MFILYCKEDEYEPLKCKPEMQQTTFFNNLSLFSEKIWHDISCESSAYTWNIMPYFLQNKKEKEKYRRLLHFGWRF